MDGKEIGELISEAWATGGKHSAASICFEHACPRIIDKLNDKYANTIGNQDIEDIVQEALIALLFAMEENPPAKPFGYLFTVAKNKCKKEANDRRQKRLNRKSAVMLSDSSIFRQYPLDINHSHASLIVEGSLDEQIIVDVSEHQKIVQLAISRTTKNSQKILRYILSIETEFDLVGNFHPVDGKAAAKQLDMTHGAYRKAKERAYISLEEEIRKIVEELDVATLRIGEPIFNLKKSMGQ